MSFSDEEYGKSIRVYRGRGHLELTNGNKLPCHIVIQQVERGLIFVTCRLSPKVAQDSSVLRFLMSFSAQEIDNIYGRTRDGMSFTTQKELFLVRAQIEAFSGRPSILRLLAHEIELWPDNKDHATHYKFSVVNFEFVGNNIVGKAIKDDPKQVVQFRTNLLLQTHWGIAVVNRVPDYDSIIKRVKAQKGIAVTCEITAKPSVSMGLKELIPKIDEVCHLLSLSRGTKITWVNAEEYMGGGKTCGIILRNAVTWPFSSLPLIDPREPSDTPLFIEQVYPTYLKLRDVYNLDIAIEQCLDAKRETAYLETRALAAVALIDSLQQQYGSGHKLTEIVKEFGNHENGIRKCLESFIISAFPSVKEEQLGEMVGKIPELNRRSFLNLLRKWVDNLDLQILASELSAIRDTRHSLAHRMCFKSRDGLGKEREYFRLVNFINMVFLKLLGYQGYFIYVDLPTLAFERRKLE